MTRAASAPQDVNREGVNRVAVRDAAWARSLEWRAVARLPLPASVPGLLLTTLLVAIYAAFEALLGPLDPDDLTLIGPFTDTQLGYGLAAAAAGYALSAGAAIAAGNAADAAALSVGGALEDVALPTLRSGRLAGTVGLIGGVAFMASVDPPARDLILGRAFSLDGLLSIACVSLAFWLSTRAAWFTLMELDAVARWAAAESDFDPLQDERFEPLGRMALRASVLWAGAAALSSVSFALTEGSVAELVACGFLVAVAVGSFLIPMLGVHERLHDAKAREIARVRTEIRRDREEVAALGADSALAAQRLPGLLAFEARLMRAREWPFDASTLRRFGLVLLLPLISWLGGALVERVVDAVLD